MALFSFLGQAAAQTTTQIFDWHVNPSNPTPAIEWDTTATPGSPSATTPYYGWFNVQTNGFGTYSAQGGGVGDIANLSRDLGANATVSLNSAVTVGTLLLGDLNGTSTYTLSGAGTLTFNSGNGSHALLNKVIGGGDSITGITMAIVGALDINVNTGTISSTAVLSGSGPVNFFGNGTIALRGNSAGYTGTTTLYGWNSTSTTARVRLGASAGNALGSSTIVIGQGTRDYAGYAVLELDSARTHFDQISNTAQLRFDGQGGRNAYFKILGGNEEVGSIWAPEGTSVIENMEGEVINTNSILTVGGNNSDSYFNGHIRNRASGTGTGTLGITKNGTGSLLLGSGNVSYTGPTTVNGGTLTLWNTTAFASAVTLTGTSTLEFRTTTDVTWNDDITMTAGNTIIKTGGSNLILDIADQYAGAFRSQAGTLTVNKDVDFNGGLTLSGGATLTVNAAGAGSSFASLSQLEGGEMTFDGSITVTGTTLLNDFGGDTNFDNVNIRAASTFLGTFTTRRRDTIVTATASFGSDIILDGGMVGGTGASVDGVGAGVVGTGNLLSLKNNGALTISGGGTKNIFLNGSYLVMDNSSVNMGDRIADNFNITSSGGLIRYLHANNDANYSETLGTITLSNGMLTFETSRSNGAFTSTVTLGGLTRTAGGYGTVQFVSNAGTANTLVGGSLSSAQNRVLITGMANTAFMGNWVSAMSVVGSTNTLEWAKYNTTTGVTPFAASDYVINSGEATWTSAQHIKLFANGATQAATLTASRSVNTLNLQKQTDNLVSITLGANVAGQGYTLKVEGGGIIYSGHTGTGQNAVINTPNNTTAVGRLMGGLVDGNYQLVTNIGPSNILTITAQIADYDNNVANATALIKTGTGRLDLGSTSTTQWQNNTYSGGTYILGGQVLLRLPTASAGSEMNGLLGAATSAITFNGGGLRLVEGNVNISSSMAMARTWRIGESGGALIVDAGRVYNQVGTITSLTGVAGSATQGAFTKDGAGNLNVTSSGNNIAGGFIHTSTGTTTFTGGNNTFGFIEHNSGILTISGTGNQIGRLRFDGGQLTISGTTITNVAPAEGLILSNGGGLSDVLTFLNGNTINRAINIDASTVRFGQVGQTFTNTFNASSVNVITGALAIASANAIAGRTLETFALGTSGGQLIFENTGAASDFTLKSLSGNNTTSIVNAGSAALDLIVDSNLNLVYDGKINQNGGAGNLSLIKRGTGMLTLNSLVSNYKGRTVVEGGVLNVVSLESSGTPSSIGASTAAASNLVLMNGTALRYSGTISGLMDRAFTIGAGTEGVSFVAAGTGSTPGATRAATFNVDPFHGHSIAYTGTGNAHIILTGSNLGDNTFGIAIGDKSVTESTSLTKTGTGTWVMDRANNTYTGTTTIMLGNLVVLADGALGAAGGPMVRLAGGSLELRGVDYSTVEDIAMEGGVLYASTGDSRWAGDIYLGVNSTINVEGGASLTLGDITGRGGLTFQGEGTLVFEGSNYPTSPALPSGYSYGSVTVQAGTLVLRYSNATENKLPGNGGLTLGGGRLGATLRIEKDNAGFTALYEDDVNGTTLSSGAHQITRADDASNIWLKLNGLNRQIGGTLELRSDTGSGNNIITTDLLNVNGILGGWATVRMADGSISWAFNSGVVASTSIDKRGTASTINGIGVADSYVRGLDNSLYAQNLWGQETSGASPLFGFLRNTDVVSSHTQTNQNTNTVRFNQDASVTQTLVGVNTIMTGGILVTPKVGESGGAKYSKIEGGTLTGGANAIGSELLINQASTNGVFEISSVIANNPAQGGAYSGTKTVGSPFVSMSDADVENIYPGMQVSGSNITEGTYVLSVDKVNNTITLSSNVTSGGDGTSTLQFNQKNGSIPTSSAIITLSSGYNSTNLYVGMSVTGPNIPAGTVITAINTGVTPHQITLSNTIASGSAGPFNFNPTNGLVKNGAGTLLLTGLNTYTGATVINEGALAVLTIADAGSASSLGAAPAAVGNLIFNGGSLLFAGEGGSSNRGFTNNNEALFDVMREAATLTFTGSTATAGSTADYMIRKLGSGTLVLTGTNSAGFGTTRISVEDGVLRLNLTSNDRFARSDVSALIVGGGTLDVFGSTGVFTQNMPQTLVINAGASTIRVTSEGTTTNMTLNLMDGTGDVTRYSGGTVFFQENPTLNGIASANGGAANIRLWLPAILSNVILPWAVYQDTSDIDQPGVNEFATSTPNLSANGIGEIVSASSLSLHNIGTNGLFGSNPNGPANAANWNGTVLNPSESDVTDINGNGLQNFAGTTPTGASVQTLRFYSATSDSTVTIGDTFLIQNGAILLANHIGNRNKSIVGGTITSGLLSATPNVVDLILHNYNPANDFVLGSQIVDNFLTSLALVHSGTGTTTLTNGANSYTGKTYLNGGVLKLDVATALSTASNLVLDGGVLGLNYAGTFNRTLGTGAGQVQFTGSGGFAAYGANRTVSLSSNAALTWGSGGFVPGSDMLLLGSHDSTHTLLFTNAIDLGRFFRVVKVNNGSAVIDGEMSGNLSGPGGSIIKTGTGTLKLSGTNTYTGPTVVANGTLIVNSASNLGATGVELSTTVESATDSTAILQLAGTVASPDVMNLPITVGNKNTDSVNVVQTQDDFNITGAVTINRTAAMGRTFIAPNANTTANFSNITGTGGITVMENSSGAGEGTVILSGANNYGTDAGYTGSSAAISGGTVVREGRVLLRNSGALGGTTVELGDARIVKTDVKWATDQRSVTALGGFFDADSDGIGLSGGPGGFHEVSPTLLGGAVALNDRVLVKDELGNPELNGIYRVAFINTDGTVNLVRVSDFDEASEMQYGSTVTVTNGSSSQNGTTWFMAAPNVTTPNKADTDPTIWLATAIDSNVSLLADTAGIVVTNAIDVNATNGAGTTSVGGSSALTSGEAQFSGAVTLQNVANGTPETKTLTATSSTTTNDGIKFSGIIGEAAAEDTLSINKTGTGRVTLSGANTYRGSTTVSQGYLRASSNNALGGTGSQGTTVADGATLELTGNITIPSTETLTISGTGVGNGGALRNVSGDNTYNGAVQLATDARINSDAGTLTLGFTPNSVTGTNRNLTVGGAGKVVMAGAISLGTGSVTKDGAGTLVLNASSTYSGGTTVNGGVLEVNNPVGGSGTGTGSINVTSGTLGGNGYIAPTATSGTSITIASGANLSVGQTGTGPVETLNIGLSGSTLVLAGTLRVDLYANEAGQTLTEMDRLVFTGTGTVNLTGSSLVIGNINNLAESALTVGSQWKLIDWGGLAVTGTFGNLTSTTIPDLPTLTGGKIWDFSQLYTQGVIGITVVPEPGRALLLLVGLGFTIMRRRRSAKA